MRGVRGQAGRRFKTVLHELLRLLERESRITADLGQKVGTVDDFGAGDRDRTGDIQLGKVYIACVINNLLEV